SWSLVEPTRGHIDQGYLDKVDAAVQAAAAHGMYVVIDMHQDAYTSTVFTTDPSTCPAGTVPAKGWDGAPAWATITDGKSTCDGPGGRNDSPAILAAWNHFYENTSGIRDEFVNTWLAIAKRFAGRPEVAGYDLLNEPETSMPSATLTPLYDTMLKQIVLGIRSTEKSAGASFGHLIFVEPTLPSAVFSNGLVIPDPKDAGVDPTNIVAAAHNYSESIGIPGISLTIEGTNNLIKTLSDARKVPEWTGEYGFFDTSPATLAKVARYAKDEDLHAWGGAWWQWRQSCGDPHGVSWVGDHVEAQTNPSVQLNGLDCPGNTDIGPTDAYLKVVGRAYPRATPGRITSLASDPSSGRFSLTAATLVAGGQLVVWTPSAADGNHTVEVSGLDHVVEHTVDGGRIITATVTCPGTYKLHIGTAVPLPASAPCPPPATPAPAAVGAASPAEAVSGTSTFTG
ncbi:MAG TPA: cellulase family glycosylhydrolase, partial [Acidimicrobiales bacterium]